MLPIRKKDTATTQANIENMCVETRVAMSMH
jgi:hypothetical protein